MASYFLRRGLQRRSSILLQSARDRVATAAETDRVTAMERHVRKTA